MQASFSLQVKWEILALDAPVSTGARWYQVLLHQLNNLGQIRPIGSPTLSKLRVITWLTYLPVETQQNIPL